MLICTTCTGTQVDYHKEGLFCNNIDILKNMWSKKILTHSEATDLRSFYE